LAWYRTTVDVISGSLPGDRVAAPEGGRARASELIDPLEPTGRGENHRALGRAAPKGGEPPRLSILTSTPV
jgi:hypothetical protein